ncbi:MAG: hypothetical protein ACOCYO_09800, partial [Bacteroidota bacterium]
MEPVELEFSQGLKVQDIKQAQDLIIESTPKTCFRQICVHF